MFKGEIELKHFHSEFLPGVVRLLRYLWGNNDSQNLEYFKWKYFDNPSSESPKGIIAVHDEKVVGFRGYLDTMWQFDPEHKKFKILCPGDTCTHPNYRRRGLSVAMGELALKEFSSECELFFNWSSSQNSYPGYLKMGFSPLVTKTYITRGNLWGIAKYLIDAKRAGKPKMPNVSFGTFENITVSKDSLPTDMYEVVKGQNADENLFRIVKNMEFLKWRFSNGRFQYRFYTVKSSGIPTGYLVLRLSKSQKRGFIIDYEENCEGAVESILKFIIKKRHFDLISVYSYGVRGDLVQSLNSLGFKLNTPLRIAEKKAWGEIPLLVRPSNAATGAEDFLLFGKDIRKQESWRLEEICSDGT